MIIALADTKTVNIMRVFISQLKISTQMLTMLLRYMNTFALHEYVGLRLIVREMRAQTSYCVNSLIVLTSVIFVGPMSSRQ